MKRTVVNMIAGLMILGGMLTAVSSQAQDRRGGGRAPQQQSQSRSSSSSQSSSRPSMGSSNSNSGGRRPSASQGSQSSNRRYEATPQPRTQQRPSTESRQQTQQMSTRQQSSNSGNVNKGATNRRPEPQVGNNGASNWPGSNANNRNSRPNNEMNTRPGNSGVNNGNARPQTGNNDSNTRPGGNNNRPDNNGNVRNDNNNNGRRPGGNTGNSGNMGNNGNRPGNDRNMGNNGNRPGNDRNRKDRNRNGNSETHRQGQGPAGGGINHNGPGAGRPDYDRYRYSSDHRLPQPRVNDRFYDHYRYNDWSWHAPMRPPHRPYRPHDPWFYRPVRPYGYTIYASAPIISGVLGLEFGTPFGSSLNFLYYNGYEIDGYYDNIVYLRDVPMLDYVWPDVMLQYDNNGLAFIQFAVSSPYDDRARFSRLYNDLCYSYGSPIRRSGYNGYFSWYGGNGVGYVNLGLTYTNGRYYTSLSFGY